MVWNMHTLRRNLGRWSPQHRRSISFHGVEHAHAAQHLGRRCHNRRGASASMVHTAWRCPLLL